MGEDAMGTQAMAQTLDGVSGGILQVNQSIGDIGNAVLEGFTPIKDDLSLIEGHGAAISSSVGEGGWFYNTLNKILDFNEGTETDNLEARGLQQSMSDSLSNILDMKEVSDVDEKNDKKKKAKASSSTKFDDLKDLPWALGTLGAVLANTIENKNKNEGKGVKGFFQGLMEGVGGIAALGVALLAFAGATLIFNFVDWGSAVIGLLAFTVFTLGMVGLSKLLGKEQENLIQFAQASLIMSAALGVFAISLYIASALFSGRPIDIGTADHHITLPAMDLGGAITALVTFGVFELGMVGLAKLLGNSTGDFSKFALGSMIMSAALVTFAVALVIASNIFKNGIDVGPLAKYINGGNAGPTVLKIDPVGAIAALGTFLAFELGLALVAKIMGSSTGDFVKFALGSIIMSGALVAFSVALVIVSHILTDGIHLDVFGKKVDLPGVDIKMAIAGIGLFVGFLVALAILANVAGGLAAPMAIMAGVSVLMSAALIAFSVALVVASVAVMGGEAEVFGAKFTAPAAAGAKALLAIPVMAAFMVAFAALGAMFLVPFAGAAMAAGIVIVSGILISIAAATILMGKAMMMASLAVTGGEAEIEGKKYSLKPYNEAATKQMFEVMHFFIQKFAETADEIGLKGAIAVAVLSVSLFPLIDAMDKMVDVVVKASEHYDDIMKIVGGDGNKLDHLMDPVLYLILGHDLSGNGGLMNVAQQMGIKGAIVLSLVGKALLPIVEAMDKMLDVVIKAGNSLDLIEKLMASEGGMKALDHLLDPVLWLILGTKEDGTGGLMYVADNMSIKGAKVLKLVGEAMIPLIEAMDKMIDVVFKAANLEAEGKTTEQLVADAMYNLNLIMIGNPEGTGFLPMFISTANKLMFTSKNAIEAIGAMPPMVEALGGLVDVIAKAGELDPEKIVKGVFGLTAAANFLETFIDTISRIIPGGIGGFFSKLGNGDPIKKLEEAHKYLQPGGVFYEIFQDLANVAKTFDGKGFENLGKVAVIGSFTTNMLESSINFKDIMGNIQAGIKKFKDPAPLTQIGNALQKVTQVQDIGNKFDPIYELANKQGALHSVASDLERIAKSYEKIGAADKLGRLPTDFSGNLQGPSVAEQKVESSTPTAKPIKEGEELKVIANILNSWNATGVRVYGIESTDKRRAIKTINI